MSHESIEIREWPANTEVRLVEDDGNIVDRFYTSDKNLELPCGIDAREQFEILEDRLSKPTIDGRWGDLNPYWQQRKEAKEKR